MFIKQVFMEHSATRIGGRGNPGRWTSESGGVFGTLGVAAQPIPLGFLAIARACEVICSSDFFIVSRYPLGGGGV